MGGCGDAKTIISPNTSFGDIIIVWSVLSPKTHSEAVDSYIQIRIYESTISHVVSSTGWWPTQHLPASRHQLRHRVVSISDKFLNLEYNTINQIIVITALYCACVNVDIRVYICTYMWLYVYEYVSVYMYLHVYVYMYV